MDRFERTSDVSPIECKLPTERILHEHDAFTFIQMISEKPSIYLNELQWALAKTKGMFVSEATICQTLKHYGFMQKMKYTALQRSHDCPRICVTIVGF